MVSCFSKLFQYHQLLIFAIESQHRVHNSAHIFLLACLAAVNLCCWFGVLFTTSTIDMPSLSIYPDFSFLCIAITTYFEAWTPASMDFCFISIHRMKQKNKMILLLFGLRIISVANQFGTCEMKLLSRNIIDLTHICHYNYKLNIASSKVCFFTKAGDLCTLRVVSSILSLLFTRTIPSRGSTTHKKMLVWQFKSY